MHVSLLFSRKIYVLYSSVGGSNYMMTLFYSSSLHTWDVHSVLESLLRVVCLDGDV
jgi:hypothetical protein